MASIYKRGNNFWVSYYVNNKQIKKSLGTSNERIARSKLKKLEYELALGDLHVATKLPLPVILEAFCKELMATRTYKSYKNDFSRLRVFFGPVCESLEPGIPGVKRQQKRKSLCVDRYAGRHVKAQHLEDITAQVINRFIAARVQKDGWSPKTANLMRQTLHKLFSYAIKHHGFCSRDRRYPNAADGTDRKREPAHQIRFLKLDEIDVQLRVLAEHPVIHAMVAVYIYAGLRREEATWLTYDDVDLSNRLIRVQAKTISGKFWQPKTKRNRVVPISDALNSVLCKYVSPTNSIWFFPSPRGKKWDPDNFSQDLKKINKAAGLNWSCLDFRHTFGSHLAQKGESLYKIAELMGNSPEICRRHYAALVPEKMTDVVEFSVEEKAEAKDNETKKMFREILDELKGKERQNSGVPNLRLVHFDDSA
ncbi:MAG: tyrosine-type recombinase/integrase [Planctomycetota bacterium]|jgi:integrase